MRARRKLKNNLSKYYNCILARIAATTTNTAVALCASLLFCDQPAAPATVMRWLDGLLLACVAASAVVAPQLLRVCAADVMRRLSLAGLRPTFQARGSQPTALRRRVGRPSQWECTFGCCPRAQSATTCARSS